MSMTVSMPDQAAIDAAARALEAGRLVAFPTETVYGLGADAENPAAIAAIYAAKGRPSNHPVIVHLAPGADIGRWASDIPDGGPSADRRLLARSADLDLEARARRAGRGGRRPGQHRPALPVAPGRASPAAGIPRRPGRCRRAVGQPFRPCQPDHRRARAGRIRQRPRLAAGRGAGRRRQRRWASNRPSSTCRAWTAAARRCCGPGRSAPSRLRR